MKPIKTLSFGITVIPTLLATAAVAVLGCSGQDDILIDDGAGPTEFESGEGDWGTEIEAAPEISEATRVPLAGTRLPTGLKGAQPTASTDFECYTGRDDLGASRNLGGHESYGVLEQTCLDVCSANSFAYGVKVKSMPEQGSGDDQGVTNIALACNNRFTGLFTGWAYLFRQPTSGTWSSSEGCGTTTNPMRKGQLKFHNSGSDQRGSSDFMGYCADGTTLNPELTSQSAKLGTWLTKQSCPTGQALCGIHIQGNASIKNDYIGAGEIVLHCCDF